MRPSSQRSPFLIDYPIRTVSALIFLALACFLGGYQLGRSNPPIAQQTSEFAQETIELSQPTNTDEPTEIVIEPAIETENPEVSFALRSQGRLQTLSDSKGRQLVGEMLKVSAESLKIRRQADAYIVNIPISMLSENDQAYAAYLLNKNGPRKTDADKSPPINQSMEDKIWDELFK